MDDDDGIVVQFSKKQKVVINEDGLDYKNSADEDQNMFYELRKILAFNTKLLKLGYVEFRYDWGGDITQAETVRWKAKNPKMAQAVYDTAWKQITELAAQMNIDVKQKQEEVAKKREEAFEEKERRKSMTLPIKPMSEEKKSKRLSTGIFGTMRRRASTNTDVVADESSDDGVNPVSNALAASASMPKAFSTSHLGAKSALGGSDDASPKIVARRKVRPPIAADPGDDPFREITMSMGAPDFLDIDESSAKQAEDELNSSALLKKSESERTVSNTASGLSQETTMNTIDECDDDT